MMFMSKISETMKEKMGRKNEKKDEMLYKVISLDANRNTTVVDEWEVSSFAVYYILLQNNQTGSIAGFTINATGMYAAQQFVKNQLPEHIQFLSSMLMPGYDRCKLTDGQVRLVTELLG